MAIRRPATPATAWRWRCGQTYELSSAAAVDGDTLKVTWSCPSAAALWPHVVRLHGIDAPELLPHPEPGAEAARDALARLLAAGPATARPRRTWLDPYGRLIASVSVAGHDLSAELLRLGFVSAFSPSLRRARRVRELRARRPTPVVCSAALAILLGIHHGGPIITTECDQAARTLARALDLPWPLKPPP